MQVRVISILVPEHDKLMQRFRLIPSQGLP
jgi:hypothetical protein